MSKSNSTHYGHPLRRAPGSRAGFDRCISALHVAPVGLALALILAIVLVLTGAPAAAQEVDSAKSSGQIGEQLDGYLGLVDSSAPDSVAALVEEVNGRRRTKYQDIASKRDTSVDAVAALAGAKLIERAEPGEYVESSKGSWTKK
jgi:uncharacterized protein YdbL (DUF1318 family)